MCALRSFIINYNEIDSLKQVLFEDYFILEEIV